MATFIALLRAVNVGGRKVPMADLRALCERLDFEEVQTYIQSGNLVFTTTGTPAAVTAKLEKAIAKKFGIEVPVILRTAEQWKAYLTVPKALAKAAAEKPNWIMLGLSKEPPKKEALAALRERAKNGEKIEALGDGIWIYYQAGVADSKLAPSFIDKVVGSPLTARNWNTVRKLGEMAGATSPTPA
ncbi:MAG TPA: DUF1697 domain-containing protein [Candidatus Thermoplasmatota archaeon]|nr:DUF1697 domain-containing protein [Candidatus Thermoplasmatota archaeon]